MKSDTDDKARERMTLTERITLTGERAGDLLGNGGGLTGTYGDLIGQSLSGDTSAGAASGAGRHCAKET